MNPPGSLSRWEQDMDYVLVIGAVVCGWAALRVIGGERERRLQDLPALMAAKAVAQAAANASAAAAAPESSNQPVRSKAGR